MSDSKTRSSGARALRALVVAVLALSLVAALGCFGPRHRRHPMRHGFTGDTSAVQVVSTEVGGKNVFIPSTIAVLSGAPVSLSIFNTTEQPHGFMIPALGIAEVLPAQEEYVIELPALDGHQLLEIKCHLHTAHRTATLVVLPAKKKRN